MAAATSVWRSQRTSSSWWWRNARPARRDRDGPSRITTRRSCDTTPSRAVIRTTISVRSPDLGCRENDTRSPRLASADKYLATPKYQRRIPLQNHSKFEGSRQTPNWTKWFVYHFLGEIEMWRTKRREIAQHETFARTIYLENFLLKKLHLIRIIYEAPRGVYLSCSCPKYSYCERLTQIGSWTNVIVSTFE